MGFEICWLVEANSSISSLPSTIVLPRSTFLDNYRHTHCLKFHFPRLQLSVAVFACTCWFGCANQLIQGPGQRVCSQALPRIVSDFLFGKSLRDFHALEDLGRCKISSRELATLNSMLCVCPQCWQEPILFHSQVVTLLGTM